MCIACGCTYVSFVTASVITTTQIHPTQGKTLGKALEKAMKQRDLDVVSCNVYTIHIVNNNEMRFVTCTCALT